MMLDPANELIPPASSPTISSDSSSDLDTESTGSFFHDRSTSLGTLMGVNLPAIILRAPSQRREPAVAVNVGGATVGAVPGRRSTGKNSNAKRKSLAAEQRGTRRWWRLCRGEDSKPSSLGEFLEVERRFGEEALYGAAVDLEGTARNGLFADGRVLPPHPQTSDVDDGASAVGSLCRFPVLLAGICSCDI